jgi:PIN domain nuclease of toxin-antitoxin system
MNYICLCMNELNLKNKPKKLELNSNKKIVTRNVTQLQLAVISLFEIKILSSTHC